MTGPGPYSQQQQLVRRVARETRMRSLIMVAGRMGWGDWPGKLANWAGEVEG
jgi:hypothetical protein